MPAIRIQAKVSVPWVGGVASSPPLTAATVAHKEHGVRTTFIKVVQWPGLCFLENMLLCPGITVCKAFVSKLGIMLFWCLFRTTLVWLFRGFPQIWFLRVWRVRCHGQCLTKMFRWPEELANPRREESSCWPAEQLCVKEGGLLSLSTQVLKENPWAWQWVLCCRLGYNVTGRTQKESPDSKGLGLSTQ